MMRNHSTLSAFTCTAWPALDHGLPHTDSCLAPPKTEQWLSGTLTLHRKGLYVPSGWASRGVVRCADRARLVWQVTYDGDTTSNLSIVRLQKATMGINSIACDRDMVGSLDHPNAACAMPHQKVRVFPARLCMRQRGRYRQLTTGCHSHAPHVGLA